MGEWARQAARALGRGVVTVIDYGDTQPGRYSAARRTGTLLGYFGGAVTANVLERPGLQDLTALVDFTALRDELASAGFQVVELTRQANYLVGLGLGTEIPMTGDETELDRALIFRRGAQALLSPEGLGSFHVLVAASGIRPTEARQALSGLRYA
jgi:SAM-dependent MidA family methyltransferase